MDKTVKSSSMMRGRAGGRISGIWWSMFWRVNRAGIVKAFNGVFDNQVCTVLVLVEDEKPHYVSARSKSPFLVRIRRRILEVSQHTENAERLRESRFMLNSSCLTLTLPTSISTANSEMHQAIPWLVLAAWTRIYHAT